MRPSILDMAFDPGVAPIEDGWGIASNCFWVIDGASSIDKRSIPGRRSDGEWLVETFNRYFGASRDAHFDARWKCAIDGIRSDFQWLNEPIKLSEMPLAVMAFVAGNDDWTRVTVGGLGDARALIRFCDGMVGVFGGDAGIQERSARTQGVLKSMAAQGISPRSTAGANMIRAQQRSNRIGLNEIAGYRAIAPGARRPEALEYGAWPASEIGVVLLLTDGLYRLVDVFRDKDPVSLLRSAESRGIQDLINQLRTLETHSSFGEVKRHDDATGLLLAFHS